MPLYLDGKSQPGPMGIDWQRVALGYEARIAELEAACRTALDAYSRVSRVRLPGDVAGDLVHARETLRRALGLAI